MKKTYETPSIEKIAFQYRNQVVATSGCNPQYSNEDTDGNRICDRGDKVFIGWAN